MNPRLKRALRHPAAIPTAAAILVLVVGVWCYSAISGTLKEMLRSELQTVLAANVEALDVWLKSHETYARSLGDRSAVREATAELLRIESSAGNRAEALKRAPASKALEDFLAGRCASHGYPGYALISSNGVTLASSWTGRVGATVQADVLASVVRVLQGGSCLVPPHVRRLPESGLEAIGSAGERWDTMFVFAPVRDEEGSPRAVLGFALDPAGTFSDILTVGRMGETGETYAFDSNGLMLSESRFEDDLRAVGLLPLDDDVHSILRVHIRDPGGNMTEGFRPETPPRARPLTQAAASAIALADEAREQSERLFGGDVEGYRDYRGVKVVGAWTWLPAYGFGVVTEVDHAEAYLPLDQLSIAFWVLFGAVAACLAGMFVYSLWTSRLQKSVEEVVQLGQYKLEEKLGEGGMGKVYKARHALMKRPVAVKTISSGAAKDAREARARFEREVVLTSQLTHPNTIAIYDYGHTPEGIFYYAMEYLEGLDLGELVDQWGPLHQGRVVHVLRQVCGSLQEAHSVGFIHRDIKPANIILCERGGIHDMVKVLDFGLVKDLDHSFGSTVTMPGVVTGTPDYLAPEVLRNAEAASPRSDLYAVAAVAYYLLTGEVVFPGTTLMEVIQAHINDEPRPLSTVRMEKVDPELERLILQSLSKDPAQRPASVEVFAERLASCAVARTWGPTEARRWWTEHAEEIKTYRASKRLAIKQEASSAVDKTLEIDHDLR